MSYPSNYSPATLRPVVPFMEPPPLEDSILPGSVPQRAADLRDLAFTFVAPGPAVAVPRPIPTVAVHVVINLPAPAAYAPALQRTIRRTPCIVIGTLIGIIAGAILVFAKTRGDI